MVCTGDGDAGGHCCWVSGVVCSALEVVDGLPRCSFMSAGQAMQGNTEWELLPIGLAFAKDHPGYDCYDWPQNIPNLTGGKCCWNGEL
jgi:hypothetical protein